MKHLRNILLFLILITAYQVSSLAANESIMIKEGFELGDKLPNITAEGIDGNIYTLNDLKEKLILVDFWASWCGPCRRENLTIVKSYNEFKDLGFTVFSFSLDTKIASWKAAILKDNLIWDYHVSELKGWHSPTSNKFGVNSIPKNFLINNKGIIIAKNIRGENLSIVLKKHLKK